ncbi:hypothetical protein LSAT2_032250 [Lamellibrachia satsuma]|nr:hypothetical protein LSAT2_032250 [Lamellibrachia satsuma]
MTSFSVISTDEVASIRRRQFLQGRGPKETSDSRNRAWWLLERGFLSGGKTNVTTSKMVESDVGMHNIVMMTDDDDELQYYVERVGHIMGSSEGVGFCVDRAWMALTVMVTAVVLAGWLGLRAINTVIIPALLGDKLRETCIMPRKRRLLMGNSAGVQTDISMRTENNWRTYLKENKYLNRMARNMTKAKTLVNNSNNTGKKGRQQRVVETDHDKNETENTQLKYILLENKEALKEKIATLEKKLFETQKRNEGLRDSLAQVERKRSASQKDVEAYWRHWQATQSLLSDAKTELSTIRRRLRRNDSEAAPPDGSGEAACLMSSSGENPSVPI